MCCTSEEVGTWPTVPSSHTKKFDEKCLYPPLSIKIVQNGVKVKKFDVGHSNTGGVTLRTPFTRAPCSGRLDVTRRTLRSWKSNVFDSIFHENVSSSRASVFPPLFCMDCLETDLLPCH